MNRSKVAIFSYQPLMAEVLHRLLENSEFFSDIVLISEMDNLVAFTLKDKPDVLVIDSGTRDHGIDISRKVLSTCADTKVVILTGIEDADHAVVALDAGVSGYISTACKKIDVVTALEFIASGQVFISPHIAALVISRMRTAAIERKKASQRKMNHREEQIAQLLLKGCTNKAIADHLGLSEKTIKHYMSTLMQKFDTRNRLELAMALPKVTEAARQYQ